jgi:hypothetical protein
MLPYMPRQTSRGFAAWANSRRVAATLLVVVAVCCVAATLFTFAEGAALRDRGVLARGEVLRVHEASSRFDYSHVVVRFADQHGIERAAEVTDYLWSPRPQVGDPAELLYDPDDPEGLIVDARMGPDFFSTWAFGIGGFVAAILAWPTWTGRLNWNRLR